MAGTPLIPIIQNPTGEELIQVEGLSGGQAYLKSGQIALMGEALAPVQSVNGKTGAVTLDAADVSAIPASDKGAAGGVATLDGSGKISASELPPLDHDAAEANSEAAMLALANISAPAICIRTDFTPAHVFYLTADPPSTLSNWVDTGEFGAGAANPSTTVGLAAKNGVANTFMRSDAAPALDQAIAPNWTGAHKFTAVSTPTQSTVTISSNTPRLEFAYPGQPDRLIFEYNSSEELQAQWFTAPGVGSIKPFLVNPAVFAVEEVFFKAEYDSQTTDSTMTVVANLPEFDIQKENGAADAKRWVFDGKTANTLTFDAVSDDGATRTPYLTVTRSGATIAGIASSSGSGQWSHTGNISASGAVAGNTTVTAGIGSNSVQMVGAASGQDVKIRALGVTDANVSIEMSAKGTGLLKMASPTTVAGALTVSGGAVSAAQGAGSASPTNSGIALATAPNWSMAQFYDAARPANDRSMDILFISDGLHMRFVNDARNAFLDFLAVTGGQGSGVTGITSTSGSGSWTHTGSHTVLQPNDVYKVWVAKSTASDTQNAPTAIGAASTYLQIGGREWKVNGFGGIGFGYVTGNTVNPPVWIGWEEKVTSSFTNGDFLIATRPTNTNVAPTERFRITAAGDATFTNPVKTGGYTVATLPAASAALQGARAYVTDGKASPTFLEAVAGGGTTVAPVFCTGSGWVFG